MASTQAHPETHFEGSATVRDLIIGLSDGLTVPFALAAGLSGVAAGSHIVVTAGLAEIAAGAIAMGLGGYLAGRSEVEHYEAELARERREVRDVPQHEEDEVREVFAHYGLSGAEVDPVVAALRARPDAWVDFMMRFELGLEPPDQRQALKSALAIGGAYALGGMIPLSPYMLASSPDRALSISIALTMLALGVFGFVRGKFSSAGPWKSCVHTLVIGCLAAGTAYALARLLA
jgi:VIT1/CCC1 family predicted Fe2+/Mn2+ transporter